MISYYIIVLDSYVIIATPWQLNKTIWTCYRRDGSEMAPASYYYPQWIYLNINTESNHINLEPG
jgi:hypothetical protein